MELNQFIQVGLPVSLALIMLSLGLTISLPDFTRQLSQPRSTLVGLSAQMLLVPLLALGIVSVFKLPPALAAGLMILSFCPGGVTSNWFSHMAKANVPLSISNIGAVSNNTGVNTRWVNAEICTIFTFGTKEMPLVFNKTLL